MVAALPAYEVGEQLGAGAFGLVLAGRHRDLGRDVAIKVVSTSQDDGGHVDFKSEARVLAGLRHPHIVDIYDYVEHGELCLIIMELLAGGTLTRRRRGGGLAAEAACAVGLAVADALTCAHSSGVLHRDIKPDNILFAADSLVKVTDFGIAKIFAGTAVTASAIVGTPKYMAPEQIETGRLGPGTDVYALGTILYESLTGKPVFDPGLSTWEIYRHQREVTPPRPDGVPAPIADVVMRTLAKDPAARHPSAHAFALDLAAAAARTYGPRWTARSGITLRISDELREAAEPRSVAGQRTTSRETFADPPADPTDRVGSTDRPAREAGGVLADVSTSRVPILRSGPAVGRGRGRWWVIGAPFVLGIGAVVAAVILTSDPGHQTPRHSGQLPVSRPALSSQVRLITTVAGTGAQGFSGDGGLAIRARLAYPDSVAVDAAGNVYFADVLNSRVRRIDSRGVITTVAGSDTAGFSGDGGPATDAQLASPVGVAVDAAGNLYFADLGNDRVRRVDTHGTITTVAGSGTGLATFAGDGGSADHARLNAPDDVVVDASGNLYISDYANYRVRRVDTRGVITTVAGTGVPGFSGDGGPATRAELDAPDGLAVDAAGNLYIAEGGDERVRRVDTHGVITTVAGTGTQGFSGDGGPATRAQLWSPKYLATDPAGNLYIAELGNERVRRVDTHGVITTVAGAGTTGFSGDGGPAVFARFDHLSGVTSDWAGNLYVADSFNRRIRWIAPAKMTRD
jgi:sugar lactone lactonase YvrE